MAGGGDGGGVGGAGGGGGGAVGGAGGGGGGGAGGAGGGGGGDGGGGDDGLATRWCAHCRKAYECHQWWIDSHRPACQNLQEERARANQRNLEQAQAKKLDKERRANKRRAKETSVKATASSKGKAQNSKRN